MALSERYFPEGYIKKDENVIPINIFFSGFEVPEGLFMLKIEACKRIVKLTY